MVSASCLDSVPPIPARHYKKSVGSCRRAEIYGKGAGGVISEDSDDYW